jgi:anti-sigma factor RsiW
MTCKGRDKEIALYVSGDLDAARTSSLEEHLSRCPACAASERAFRRNAEALGELANARLDRAAEESFHRQVVALLRSGDGTAPAHVPWLNRRAAVPFAMAACALAAVLVGAAYTLMREARPAMHPVERLEEVAQQAPPLPPFVPPVSLKATRATPSKAASPTLTPSTKVQSQMAKRAIRRKNTPPQKEEEALVIRLQTDDPDVVIYWQLQNRGG